MKLSWVRLQKSGFMVLYSVVQSTEIARRLIESFIMSMYLLVSCSQSFTKWSGGTSRFLMLCSFSVSTSVGSPWQSHPCGKRTL